MVVATGTTSTPILQDSYFYQLSKRWQICDFIFTGDEHFTPDFKVRCSPIFMNLKQLVAKFTKIKYLKNWSTHDTSTELMTTVASH